MHRRKKEMDLNAQHPSVPEPQRIMADSLVYLRAHELWKACGCPAEGPALDHWFDAVRAIQVKEIYG